MSQTNDGKHTASQCLAAWSRGDLQTTRSLLSDDVTFHGPLGSAEGADAYIEGIQGMVAIVDRTEQLEVFAEGENVCIIYHLVTHTPSARLATAGWYRVADGRITSVRAFFDPRPLLNARSG